MHELPVTQSILEIALRHAAQAGAQRVTDVHLVIGELATVVGDSVQFYWEIVAKDTPAAGAKLHFRRIEARLSCMSCGHQYRPAGGGLICPACGGAGARIEAGEEFFVEAIEVEPQTNKDGQNDRTP